MSPEAILDPLPIDRAAKSAAWDAVHSSQSPEQLQATMEDLPLPRAAKSALWNIKANLWEQDPGAHFSGQMPDLQPAEVEVPIPDNPPAEEQADESQGSLPKDMSAQPVTAIPASPGINPNAFLKAHNLWNDTKNRMATEHIKKFPGASFDDALAATDGTYGIEPKPEDFKAPPEPAPEPEPLPVAEPSKPDTVQRVGPDTPNPPTAAIPTQPESPETIALQMGQLRDGARRVVMFPQGGGQPFEAEHFGDAPIGITHDPFGNTYAYRKDLIAEGDIHRAAKDNTLPEILGGRGGLGAPDKTAIQSDPIAVVARGPDGTEAQTTVTDAAHLPETHSATQAVMPAGGSVSIEQPADILARRAGVPPAAVPVSPQNYRQLMRRTEAAGLDSGQFPKTVGGRLSLRDAIVAKEQANAQQSTEGDHTDLGATTSRPAGPDQGGAPSGTVSDGNGPVPVRQTARIGGATGNNGLEPNTGDLSQGVRRITGSADIPLTATGRDQAEFTAATKAKQPFDVVLSAPTQRSQDTAKRFGVPQPTPVLEGWPRGALEGLPAKRASKAMKDLVLNPDTIPPGVSPISGKPGISWNEMAKPMFQAIQRVSNTLPPEKRALVVTSGGNLQAINAWGKAGYPPDFEFPHQDMAGEPHWSVTGRLFTLGPEGLEEVKNNAAPGRLYLMEHAETAFNPKDADGADKGPLIPQAAASNLKERVRSLPLASALRVYDASPPADRNRAQRDLRNRVFAAAKHAPEQFGASDSDTRQLTQKYFNFRPPLPSAVTPMGEPTPIE